MSIEEPQTDHAADEQLWDGNDAALHRENDLHLTDIGNACRLVRRHGADLRYVHSLDQWFIWNPARGIWQKDETGEITRRAIRTILACHAEALLEDDEAIRKPRLKHFLQSESEPALRRMTTVARSSLGTAATIRDFDTHPWELNLPNGILDLKTGTLLPHDRLKMHSKQGSVPFDPAATAPRFQKFIEEITCGDSALACFIQRALGYSLTGDTREHCVFFPHGLGSNGKSTLLELVRAIMGDYASVTETASFTVAKGEDGRPRNDLARLPGVRFLTAIESEEGAQLAEGLIKSMTGGDTVVARFLYGEHFEFKPAFKLWFATNHKPFVRGSDEGIWRRMRLIPFDASFTDAQRDTTLGDRLLRDEGPGVLNWLLAGCLDWQEHGLPLPEVVAHATRSYRSDQDTIGRFLAEKCDTGPLYSESSKRLYETFREWMVAAGERPWSKKALGLRLAERGFQSGRDPSGRERVWNGIAFTFSGS